MSIETPLVKFVSTIEGLTLVPECIPKPSQKYIPEWWKQVAHKEAFNTLDSSFAGNIKSCPSFIDYFTKGFMLPMWTDTIVAYDVKTKNWKWRTSDDKFSLSHHGNEQYVNLVNHKFLGEKTYFIFKLNSPWKMITPAGYSTLQLPATYHFNDDFSIMPGIRDTDFYHNLSIQLLIHSPNKEIYIPRGTPLAHYFPYKRVDETLEVLEFNDASEEDKLSLKKMDINMTTKLPGTATYYKNQRKEYNE